MTFEEKMKTVVFFIEATDYEQLSIWREYHKETSWEEDNRGFWETIGYLDGEEKQKPVCVSFTFAKIYGKRICFYNVTSRYSDHTMVEEYITKNWPIKYDNGTRKAMTDAMNFHLALLACEESEIEDFDKILQVE